ncbi:MAG: cupin domain-containing protein [Actinomycetia bacterium]|nr:cupin domain-containing protein [Actinomycetes bacterium]
MNKPPTSDRSSSVLPLQVGAVESMSLEPTSYVTADNVLHGEPAERGTLVHTSGDGSFLVGVWSAEPYAETFPAGYPGDEFAQVIEGRLTLVDPDGSSQTFSAGDSYVMTKGWAGSFQVDTTFTKYFVLHLS